MTESFFSGFFLLRDAWWDSYDSLRIRSWSGELKKLLLISSSSKLWLSSTKKKRKTMLESSSIGLVFNLCLDLASLNQIYKIKFTGYRQKRLQKFVYGLNKPMDTKITKLLPSLMNKILENMTTFIFRALKRNSNLITTEFKFLQFFSLMCPVN